jgi:hypothetical protein
MFTAGAVERALAAGAVCLLVFGLQAKFDQPPDRFGAGCDAVCEAPFVDCLDLGTPNHQRQADAPSVCP